MITRIKYTKVRTPTQTYLTSGIIINYEGNHFVVNIYDNFLYILIKNKKQFDILEEIRYTDLGKAKRIARKVLEQKYNVRFINEVRR